MADKKGYSEADVADVSDNPEWTPDDIAAAVPFRKAFPELSASLRSKRGPQKAPTKTLVSLRLDQDVIDKFRSSGPGWQARINEVLRRASV